MVFPFNFDNLSLDPEAEPKLNKKRVFSHFRYALNTKAEKGFLAEHHAIYTLKQQSHIYRASTDFGNPCLGYGNRF
jgi:hypothetical protein